MNNIIKVVSLFLAYVYFGKVLLFCVSALDFVTWEYSLFRTHIYSQLPNSNHRISKYPNPIQPKRPVRWDRFNDWRILIYPLSVLWLTFNFLGKLIFFFLNDLVLILNFIIKFIINIAFLFSSHDSPMFCELKRKFALLQRFRKVYQKRKNRALLKSRAISIIFNLKACGVLKFRRLIRKLRLLGYLNFPMKKSSLIFYNLVACATLAFLCIFIKLTIALSTSGGYYSTAIWISLLFLFIFLLWITASKSEIGNFSLPPLSAPKNKPKTRKAQEIFNSSISFLVLVLAFLTIYNQQVGLDIYNKVTECLPQKSHWNVSAESLTIELHEGDINSKPYQELDSPYEVHVSFNLKNQSNEPVYVKSIILETPENFQATFLPRVGTTSKYDIEILEDGTGFKLIPTTNDSCGMILDDEQDVKIVFQASTYGSFRGDFRVQVFGKRFLANIVDEIVIYIKDVIPNLAYLLPELKNIATSKQVYLVIPENTIK